MPAPPLLHPILQQSFAVIDQEIGDHSFDAPTYAILQRVIHSTADFDFQHLLYVSPTAIADAQSALAAGAPIITDVTMVKQGIVGMVSRTFGNPVIAAIDYAQEPEPGQTRSANGMIRCWEQNPTGIFVIGNAPTALIALCDRIQQSPIKPTLVIGAPVGFIAVEESKHILAETDVPQIRLDGRKGGSAAAAAIVNALLVLAVKPDSRNL